MKRPTPRYPNKLLVIGTAVLVAGGVLRAGKKRYTDDTNVGWWLGGGWDSGITFTKLQVSGRLDPAWMTKALGALPKGR